MTEAVVLLVDSEETVANTLSKYIDDDAGLSVETEASLSAGRERLAADSPACLVVHIDPLDDDGRQLVTDAKRLAPNCSVIVLSGQAPATLPADICSQATSIVETGDDPENWRFLVEKIKRAVQEHTTDRETDQLYRTLVEAARDGLYRLDADGNVVYANEAFAEILGYSRAEILGGHGSRPLVEGELERGQRVIQQVLESDSRDSDIIDLEMETKDGERITVAVRFTVLTTDDGTYDGVVGVARDVTDRRAQEQELERKNEQLEEFASVVSHDLRNPLHVAEGQLELARAECDSASLDEVAAAHERMETLIDDLLALAQSDERIRETEPVSLAAMVDQCWTTVKTDAATLVIDTDRTLSVDPSRFRELLENLLRNAIKHGGTDVTVTVGDLDGGFYVADDGSGIPEAAREHIFETGYSTVDDGTGFGLNIVEEVADAHGWEVRVTESADGGARFEILGVSNDP